MSRLPFELLLAFRYLRPKRTFVSVITLISILGVMLGVAVLIVVISVMTGFDRQLRDRILGFNAHLRIYSDAPIKDYSELVDFVSSNELVRGTAPFVIGRVMVRTQPEIGSSRTDAPYSRIRRAGEWNSDWHELRLADGVGRRRQTPHLFDS
jgi:lipoprotein-releasing system permease protein